MNFLGYLMVLPRIAWNFVVALLFAGMQASYANTSGGEDDIRDIRGLWVPDHTKIFHAILLALAIVGIIALCVWLFRRWKRKKQKVKSLSEVTMDLLEEAASLIQEGNAKEFSGRVSGIVRNYLELRFTLRVTHQTTEEFLRTLAIGTEAQLEEHRELLEDFLQYCDLVKFAKSELSGEQMGQMLESAKRFVQATEPHSNLKEGEK